MFTIPDAYNRFMGRWSRLLAVKLIDFVRVNDSSSILDVGCGTGSLSFEVAERMPDCRVIGIDISKEYIKYAVKRNPFHATMFTVGDALSLPFPEMTFDYVLSILVLNFIPEPSKAVKEMQRVTKRGGIIASAVWDYGEGMEMLKHFWDAAETVDPSSSRYYEKNMPLCRKGEIRNLFFEAGLYDIIETSLEIRMDFSSFYDYWKPFLLSQGPAGLYVKRLMDKDSYLLSALYDELRKRLHIKDEAAPFTLRAKAWAAKGANRT